MLRQSTKEVHLLGKQGRWHEAIQILSGLDEAALQIDARFLSGVVGACAKAARWWAALAFLELVDERRLESDVISHNKVISACERESLWEINIVFYCREFKRNI